MTTHAIASRSSLRNHNTVRRCAAALLAAAGIAPLAQAAPESIYYLGTSMGGVGAVPDKLDAEKDHNGHGRPGLGLYGGVRLGNLPVGQGLPVSAELGYQSYAHLNTRYNAANNTTTDLNSRGHSVYAAAKVDVPLNTQFSLYGKLGVARNSVSGATPVTPPGVNIEGTHVSPMLGLGAQYAFDNGLTLRGELVGYGKASANSGAGGVALGLGYRF